MILRRGPLVLPRVHRGSYALILGPAQFVVIMLVVEFLYPSYSPIQNYISDLGNTKSSPFWFAYDTSLVAYGVIGAVGLVLIRGAFPPRRTREIALGVLFVTAGSAIVVGATPENVNGTIHGAFSAAIFVSGGAGLLLLPLAMLRDTRWDHYRLYTLVSGAVTLGAVAVGATGRVGPLGVGGIERVIVAPLILWGLVAGVHLARIPVLRGEAI